MLRFSGVKNAMEFKHTVLDAIDAMENAKLSAQADLINRTAPTAE